MQITINLDDAIVDQIVHAREQMKACGEAMGATAKTDAYKDHQVQRAFWKGEYDHLRERIGTLCADLFMRHLSRDEKKAQR